MTEALLLVAHGSRRARANQEVIELTSQLRKMAGTQFSSIDCAFLEFKQPSIPVKIDALIGVGVKKIVVLPYFLAAGRHIAEDIPAQIADKEVEYPHVHIEMAPYLGSSKLIPQLLLSLAHSRGSSCA